MGLNIFHVTSVLEHARKRQIQTEESGSIMERRRRAQLSGEPRDIVPGRAIVTEQTSSVVLAYRPFILLRHFRHVGETKLAGVGLLHQRVQLAGRGLIIGQGAESKRRPSAPI
jgi:hypothetical protein